MIKAPEPIPTSLQTPGSGAPISLALFAVNTSAAASPLVSAGAFVPGLFNGLCLESVK